jgi:hypothetical protein
LLQWGSLISPLMTIPEPRPTPHLGRAERLWWIGLLAATTLNCAFQIAWFWRFRARNLTEDGIAYIGLARHLMDGDFRAFLHGYWSPLTSWIIAATAVCSRIFALTGRLVTIARFALCRPLLYVLTLKLWHSRAAAALAVFWFSVAHGVVVPSRWIDHGGFRPDRLRPALFHLAPETPCAKTNRQTGYCSARRLGWHSGPRPSPCHGCRSRLPPQYCCEMRDRLTV